tara:strand:- start:7350 stop:7517 length:168 start_codon:yes stop_codon:yes gene_type:complete
VSKEGKIKASKLINEILDISYPLCKHEDREVSVELSKINDKTYKLLKLLEHKEVE